MASGATLRTLTPLQRKLIKGVLSGKSVREAAEYAGYSPNNPRQAGYQALNALKQKMPQVMDRMGLTQEALIAKYLLPALSAEDTMLAQFEGKFTDEKKTPAWNARNKALETAFKLRNAFPQSEQQDPGKQQIQVVVISADTRPPIEVKAIEAHAPDAARASEPNDLKVTGTFGAASR
jgi:hypothetical protein